MKKTKEAIKIDPATVKFIQEIDPENPKVEEKRIEYLNRNISDDEKTGILPKGEIDSKLEKQEDTDKNLARLLNKRKPD